MTFYKQKCDACGYRFVSNKKDMKGDPCRKCGLPGVRLDWKKIDRDEDTNETRNKNN